MGIFIYSLTDPRTGQVRYVGKTIEPAKRLSVHLWRAKRGNTHRDAWIRQVVASGETPAFAVLEVCSEENWQERERHWIQQFHNLTNICEGGRGVQVPGPRSDTWRARMGAAHKGKRVSRETRDKLRAANLQQNAGGCKNGHPWTPENTRIAKKNGHEYRACRACSREWQQNKAREKGVVPIEQYRANYQPIEVCAKGHKMEGDNVRTMKRSRGNVERVCRECVRIRNKEAKRRKRGIKK